MITQKKCPSFVRWIISKQHLHEVSPKLLQEKNETAGAIIFNNTDHTSSNVVFNSTGKTDSVLIQVKRNHLLSFHTHPAAAYIHAGCVYGHPSGDDLAEFVRLSLQGVLNHAVFTLEGIYLIQIHPRFVEFVRRLKEPLQEELFHSIYVFFRRFHGKRTLQNVKKKKYTPREFVSSVNTFKVNQKMKYKYHKVFSCVWYFSDNFLQFEKHPDELWKQIKQHTIPVTYHSTSEVSFQFLDLPIEERTLSTITRTVEQCVRE